MEKEPNMLMLRFFLYIRGYEEPAFNYLGGKGLCAFGEKFALTVICTSTRVVPTSLMTLNTLKGKCKFSVVRYLSCLISKPVSTFNLLIVQRGEQ